MLIQFDREDSENLVLTFDNSDSDNEQMQDFIAWLEASNLDYSKLKMKIPGLAEKVTNLFVKKQTVSKTQNQVSKPVSKSVTKSVTKPVTANVSTNSVEKVEVVAAVAVAEESESDSEEQENVVAAVASLFTSTVFKAERINFPPTAIENRSLSFNE